MMVVHERVCCMPVCVCCALRAYALRRVGWRAASVQPRKEGASSWRGAGGRRKARRWGTLLPSHVHPGQAAMHVPHVIDAVHGCKLACSAQVVHPGQNVCPLVASGTTLVDARHTGVPNSRRTFTHRRRSTRRPGRRQGTLQSPLACGRHAACCAGNCRGLRCELRPARRALGEAPRPSAAARGTDPCSGACAGPVPTAGSCWRAQLRWAPPAAPEAAARPLAAARRPPRTPGRTWPPSASAGSQGARPGRAGARRWAHAPAAAWAHAPAAAWAPGSAPQPQRAGRSCWRLHGTGPCFLFAASRDRRDGGHTTQRHGGCNCRESSRNRGEGTLGARLRRSQSRKVENRGATRCRHETRGAGPTQRQGRGGRSTQRMG